MTVEIDMGATATGGPAVLDLEELLATRLLVQGNSGSGKSHLLRRLIEQSAPWVQQAIVDPEGDFVTLAETFGHVVVDGAHHPEAALAQIATRVRQHRVSVVLTLESLEAERQMRQAAAFLNGLFDAERDHWHSMLVVVDEAQLFAPAAGGDVADEARKASLLAMTNLMCRGRKRGLAGVIATQRLAKLAKNVAAEASNFLMGRTFLDIDMARAADLLGMERRQAEMFRDLGRGHFIALGPALSRRPLPIRIGAVTTSARSASPRLAPLPPTPLPEDARALLFTLDPNPSHRPPAARPMAEPTSVAAILAQVAQARSAPPLPPRHPAAESEGEGEGEDIDPDAIADDETPFDETGPEGAEERGESNAPEPGAEPADGYPDPEVRAVLAAPDAATRPIAQLYKDYLVRHRALGWGGHLFDLDAFRRQMAMVRAGVDAHTAGHPDWTRAVDLAAALPEDLQAVFLLLARAALTGAPCPTDTDIARARGSQSPRRGRGLLGVLEQRGEIEIQTDAFGLRAIALPALGWRTAPAHPDEDVAAG
jgi:uncharacterized protein